MTARENACDECGCIHGPGNTNSLCPRASNFNGELSASLSRENAETADLTLEVESLRGELENLAGNYATQCKVHLDLTRERNEFKAKVQSLTEQLAEATGLLERCPMADPDLPTSEHTQQHYEGWRAFAEGMADLLYGGPRAPAQAAEPSMQERIAAAYGAGQSEAQAKLAAAVKALERAEQRFKERHHGTVIMGEFYDTMRALLAPSQSEGGGGK